MDTSKPWKVYRVTVRDFAGLPASERRGGRVAVAWVVACSSRRAALLGGVPAPRVFLCNGYGRWGYWVDCAFRESSEAGGTFDVTDLPRGVQPGGIPGVVLVDAEF